MTSHQIWYVGIKDTNTGTCGYGEVAPLPGLSAELDADFDKKLFNTLRQIQQVLPKEFSAEDVPLILDKAIPPHLPSLRFGVETALFQLLAHGAFELFPSAFTMGELPLPINGLIWMGSKDHMQQQAIAKPEQGFTCVKMKIGAIHWEEEKSILESLRKQFSADRLIMRVDANGGIKEENANQILSDLQSLQVHSIEQPFAKGNHALTKHYIDRNIVPIALDEELLGVQGKERTALIEKLQPHYLVLKPGLLGGAHIAREWIDIATSFGAGWWITSALESNVGLNAITQFTASLKPKMHQGLGTGALYHNNIPSPLMVSDGHIYYHPERLWGIKQLNALPWQLIN